MRAHRTAVAAACALVACAALVACGSAYTSMRKLDDGSYLLSKNSEGVWRVSGHLYRCTADGDRLLCHEVSNN